jgi:Skp family chaperone for outer membrane proteins
MKNMTRFSIVALCAITTAGLSARADHSSNFVNGNSSGSFVSNAIPNKPAASKPCDICVVDANEIMSKTKKAKEENEKLGKKQQQLTSDVQKIAGELKGKMDELDAKKSTLSQKAIENLQNEILALRGKYESTVQTSENQLKLAVQRATESLSAEAESAGAVLAKQYGFDVVLDAASGRPIYVSEKVKTNTQEFVKIMDKNYDNKAKTAKA